MACSCHPRCPPRLGSSSTETTGASSRPMGEAPTSRSVLQALQKQRLVDLGRVIGVAVAVRPMPGRTPRSRSSSNRASSASRPPPAARRDELRPACRAHGLDAPGGADEGGREDAADLARALAHHDGPAPPRAGGSGGGEGGHRARDGRHARARLDARGGRGAGGGRSGRGAGLRRGARWGARGRLLRGSRAALPGGEESTDESTMSRRVGGAVSGPWGAHEKGRLACANRPEWLLYRAERETRFELATSTLARLHSTTELLPQGPEGTDEIDREAGGVKRTRGSWSRVARGGFGLCRGRRSAWRPGVGCGPAPVISGVCGVARRAGASRPQEAAAGITLGRVTERKWRPSLPLAKPRFSSQATMRSFSGCVGRTTLVR